MLRVSETQYAALEAHYSEEFAEQMVGTLFRSFPTDCAEMSHEEALAFVRASIGRARAIGARRGSEWGKFVVTEFVLGTRAMDAKLAEQRERLLARDGSVDPTILIHRTYEAMLAQLAAPKRAAGVAR